MVGTCARGPKWMVIEYGKLDARYWPTKDPLVMSISFLELGVMGPLCILWYALLLSFNVFYLKKYSHYFISCKYIRGEHEHYVPSHQCDLGSNPSVNAICGCRGCCWFSPLLWKVFLREIWFSSLYKNQHFQNSNATRNQVSKELCGCATLLKVSKSLVTASTCTFYI